MIIQAFNDLPIKIYADGANLADMLQLNEMSYIKGLTTNPTLMKKEGVGDYETFGREVLEHVTSKPISFEVFSDDFQEMEEQAKYISSWQKNVYVKIPITNSRGESSIPLIRSLVDHGVRVNVTAILTLQQVTHVAAALNPEIPAVVSVFAGRIADTGRDPIPYMKAASMLLDHLPKAELLWASAREALNIFHAAESDCDIVTVPKAFLDKLLKLYHMDLEELSLQTVKMFRHDAEEAGFSLLCDTHEAKVSVG